MVVAPADTPYTVPLVFTVATDVVRLDQVPPDVPSVSVVDVPLHSVDEPEIAATTGTVITVTVATEDVVPHELVTV